MEKKKSNKGLIVLVVILIVLLLGAIGYICYDTFVLDKNSNVALNNVKKDLESAVKEKDDALDKEKSALKEIDSLKKKIGDNSFGTVSSSNYIVSHIYSKKDVNIYGICNAGMLYAYNGKMYFGKSTGEESDFYAILRNSTPNKSDKTSGYSVTYLGLKESEVNKIIVTNNRFTTDAQQSIFVILSDGSVRYYSTIDLANNSYELILKKYKVLDLSIAGCGKTDELGCTSLKYELTLMDGTKKTVEE